MAQVDAMPWWERRMYIEGLDRERARQAGEDVPDDDEDEGSDDLGRLEAMGITVRRAG
jgi:hypothetical protein